MDKTTLFRTFLGVVVVGLTTLTGCALKAKPNETYTVMEGSDINRELVQKTWQEAVALAGGDPNWTLPADLVIKHLPMQRRDVGSRTWGETWTEAVTTANGDVLQTETIILYLDAGEMCLVPEILRHEMMHMVYARRVQGGEFPLEVTISSEDFVREMQPVKICKMQCDPGLIKSCEDYRAKKEAEEKEKQEAKKGLFPKIFFPPSELGHPRLLCRFTTPTN